MKTRDAINSRILIEPYEGMVWWVCNQPPLPLTQEQMDFTYSLPYERTYHPKYKYVPAIEEVQFSITSNRGCFGSCASLRHHFASGPGHLFPQRGQRGGRSEEDHRDAFIQGLYPRCRRTERQLFPPGL